MPHFQIDAPLLGSPDLMVDAVSGTTVRDSVMPSESGYAVCLSLQTQENPLLFLILYTSSLFSIKK